MYEKETRRKGMGLSESHVFSFAFVFLAEANRKIHSLIILFSHDTRSDATTTQIRSITSPSPQ
jgi:hypothetical protein